MGILDVSLQEGFVRFVVDHHVFRATALWRGIFGMVAGIQIESRRHFPEIRS